MQLRREFTLIGQKPKNHDFLPQGKWVEWMDKISKYADIEGSSRPSIADINTEYNKETITCEGVSNTFL